MNEWNRLNSKLMDLENQLESITIRGEYTSPWAPGVTDQYKIDTYSTIQYTNPEKANKLKAEIRRIKDSIERYRANIQRQEAEKYENGEKYYYKANGEMLETDNPAIAARYNAQNRFYGESKIKQVMYVITLQKKKFDKLWMKSAAAYGDKQEEIARDLDKLFR